MEGNRLTIRPLGAVEGLTGVNLLSPTSRRRSLGQRAEILMGMGRATTTEAFPTNSIVTQTIGTVQVAPDE